MKKIYRSVDELPEDKFHKRKRFKNQKSYDKFMKIQSVKKKFRMFFWSVDKEYFMADDSIVVTFNMCKLL